MQRLFLTLALPLTLAAALSAQEDIAKPAAAPPPDAKTALDHASYAIGMNIGRNFASEGLEVNVEQLIQGIKDSLQGAKPKFTDAQLQAAIEVFGRDAEAKRQKRGQVLAEKNKRDGQAYLTANKAKAGVKTLPSGLQYESLKAGRGPTPKATDTVRVHYEGTLTNGTVFDSSIKRGEPATFGVTGVIPGWTEALQLMRVGDKWRLVLPADLAYGERGAGRDIGPNAVLVFEVELLGIEQVPTGPQQ